MYRGYGVAGLYAETPPAALDGRVDRGEHVALMRELNEPVPVPVHWLVELLSLTTALVGFALILAGVSSAGMVTLAVGNIVYSSSAIVNTVWTRRWRREASRIAVDKFNAFLRGRSSSLRYALCSNGPREWIEVVSSPVVGEPAPSALLLSEEGRHHHAY